MRVGPGWAGEPGQGPATSQYVPRLTKKQKLFYSPEPEEIETSGEMIEESLTPLVTDTGPLPSSDSTGGYTTPETALQKYQQLLKGYAGKQNMLTTGVGAASQALQEQSEKDRRAREGLGTLNPQTFLEQLTTAANAASGAIGEQRGTRKEQELATAKELARLEAAGAEATEERRRWEIEQGQTDPAELESDYYATQASHFKNNLGLSSEKNPEKGQAFDAYATRYFDSLAELFEGQGRTAITQRALTLAAMAADREGDFAIDVAEKLAQSLELSKEAKKAGLDPIGQEGTYEFFADVYKKNQGQEGGFDWDTWEAFILTS